MIIIDNNDNNDNNDNDNNNNNNNSNSNSNTCIQNAGGSFDPKAWPTCSVLQVSDISKYNECVYNGYKQIIYCFQSFCNTDPANTVSTMIAARDQFENIVKNTSSDANSKPAVQQPVAQQPAAQQPVAQQPVAQQPTQIAEKPADESTQTTEKTNQQADQQETKSTEQSNQQADQQTTQQTTQQTQQTSQQQTNQQPTGQTNQNSAVAPISGNQRLSNTTTDQGPSDNDIDSGTISNKVTKIFVSFLAISALAMNFL
ncbi:hypothetical protein PIROE2DRAFT_16986 [Piromyces sp. E2]|nr:hypothetical protein PIROE2DRAFT_16986 [Piromyces sp. E2]|eukprot:OUM57887.1 hypothetical protein PIROE2DRAFT_16986 [Piromyces sp. E2]